MLVLWPPLYFKQIKHIFIFPWFIVILGDTRCSISTKILTGKYVSDEKNPP